MQVGTLFVDLGPDPEALLVLRVVVQGQRDVPQRRQEVAQLVGQAHQQVDRRPVL
jgi:hypothetical protein